MGVAVWCFGILHAVFIGRFDDWPGEYASLTKAGTRHLKKSGAYPAGFGYAVAALTLGWIGQS